MQKSTSRAGSGIRLMVLGWRKVLSGRASPKAAGTRHGAFLRVRWFDMPQMQTSTRFQLRFQHVRWKVEPLRKTR